MSVNRARVAFHAVERKQAFCARHPEVQIRLVWVPEPHWTAFWVGTDGQVSGLANYELDLLLDELEGLAPGAPGAPWGCPWGGGWSAGSCL